MKFLVVIFFGLFALVALGESKSFGPLTEQSSLGEVVNQGFDVITGKRDLQIDFDKGTISTSYTNNEIIQMVAIGVGVLLALLGCCACMKYCCCSKKTPTVIMYQQMPPQQPITPSASAAIIPMETARGHPPIHSEAPPPYPGFPV